MLWVVLHTQGEHHQSKPAFQAGQHQKDRASQAHHLEDTPSSHDKHQACYGSRRRETRLDDSLKEFPNSGEFPSEENEAWRLKRKASYYVILNGELFKRGLTIPLFKCLNSQQSDYAMRELHEGICNLHIGDARMQPKWCVSATIGWYSGSMPLTTQSNEDDVKNSQTFHAPLLTISIAWAPFGPSSYGGWTYWDHFQKSQEWSSSYWSPSTISQNGLRQGRYEKSQPTR